MTLSVSLLTPPNDRGNVRLDAATGLIDEGTVFSLRYLVHGRPRRAVVQCLRVTHAGAGRDVVTVRIVSDAAAQARDEQRRSLGVVGRARRVSDDPVEAARAFAVELADISRTGVGFASEVVLAAGEQIAVEVEGDDEPTAVVIVRHDPDAPAPYGARFVEGAAGEAFFASMLGAVWKKPAAQVEELVGEAATGPRPSRGSGMRTRRAS
jgi:hypothetical protein